MQPVEILELGRGPTLTGTRITVYDIIPYLEAGDTPFSIAAALLLSSREVEALLKYIEDHKDVVMAHHRMIEERIARGNPPEVEAILQSNRGRVQALREDLRRKRAAQEVNGARHSG